MLQSMRENAKSWGSIIVVAIIAFMMAITGLESLTPNLRNKHVAKVNGEEISQFDFLNAQEQQRRMLMQRMGEHFDPALINEAVFVDSVLNGLIDNILQMQDAKSHRMLVSEAAVDKQILGMTEFQKSGRFDQDYYVKLLRNVGMTPQQFRNLLIEETLLNQLRFGFAGSEFTTEAESDAISRLENQTRDIKWQKFAIGPIRVETKISEEEIENYYKERKEDYMTQEKVVIQYVEINKKQLSLGVKVDEESIQREYNIRLEKLKQSAIKQVRISTILVVVNEKRNREEAKKRAEKAYQDLGKGESFEKLARLYSDDKESAKKGGDMGFVQPGFFGEVFDEAVASLNIGEISKPVETPSGLQIIKVTDRKDSPSLDLESVRQEIIEQLQLEMVDTMYLEKIRQLADIAFESADLERPSKDLSLSLHISEAFGRNGSASGIASNDQIVKAAFGEDVLKFGVNSDVIEVGAGRSIVLRVQEHRPPKLKTLSEVQESIVEILKNNIAKEKLLAVVKSRIESLTQQVAQVQDDQETWQEQKKVTRSANTVPSLVLKKAFSMPKPSNDVPSYDYVSLSGGDIMIVSVVSVYSMQPDSNSESDKMLRRYISNNKGRQIQSEYLSSLKSKADIVKNLGDNKVIDE